jgi:hypothetical protein
LCDLQTIRKSTFFLLYHGKGYDKASIGSMTLDDFTWHAAELHAQLKAEADAQQERIAQMKKSQAARRR